MKDYVKKLTKKLGTYKYVLLVIAVGLILIMWPNAPPSNSAAQNAPYGATEQVSPASTALEYALGDLINTIDGVGRAKLLLTEKGALVVCDGAADSNVRMKVLEAVASVTNLSYDRISVIKMKT